LELFRQCGIFLLEFGAVQTVWYVFSFIIFIDINVLFGTITPQYVLKVTPEISIVL
jgi:hypothetical protein